ncbi:ATP-binding protein [Pseudofrankia saprophytica]|uniref:ATP-binding protein n=1 Tax=Pseudofrankia saprophytica TaxID=298655 RepID=UPI0012FEF836|nr:ATP-binding protein [Pseudofrankia saprophytica]
MVDTSSMNGGTPSDSTDGEAPMDSGPPSPSQAVSTCPLPRAGVASMTCFESSGGRDPNRLSSGSPRTPELSTTSAAAKALPAGMPRQLTVRDKVEANRSIVRWLASTPAAPAVARWQTHATLSGWRLLSLLDDAQLVISELVANAVTASTNTNTPDPLSHWIAVRLTDTDRRLVIEVFDTAPAMPARSMPDPLAESGHGLHLVDALATWGSYPTATGPGKIVWAALDHDRPEAGRGDESRSLPRRAPTALAVGDAPAVHDLVLLRRIRDGLLTGVSPRTGCALSERRSASAPVRTKSRP